MKHLEYAPSKYAHYFSSWKDGNRTKYSINTKTRVYLTHSTQSIIDTDTMLERHMEENKEEKEERKEEE